MNKTKAIIVDDEARARSVIGNLLKDKALNIDVIDEASDIQEAVFKIKRHKPQVVFLDVKMPNYSGYEIVNFFKEINFEIIFVTAYDEYAIKAFELCAVDYLVKPIDRNRLKDAVQKLNTKLNNKDKLTHYEILLETVKTKEFKKLVIPESGNKRIVNIESIIAIEADGAYSNIHLKDDKVLFTSKNLKYYEDILETEVNFFRSHRSWIVNLDFLKSINRSESKLFLKGKIEARISRSQYEVFDNKMI